MRSCEDGRWQKTTGASLVETVVVMALVASAAGVALPATASALDEGKAREAAAFAAGRFRDMRQQAVMRTANAGLVFDELDGRWTFRVCVDGNGNGLRRADIKDGRDTCDAPTDLSMLFPGISVAVDAALPGPDNDPGTSDPVRFGASDIASFSPTGGCTAGSLFLRSAKGVQYAVRIAGVTGRLRTLRYDAATRVWREL